MRGTHRRDGEGGDEAICEFSRVAGKRYIVDNGELAMIDCFLAVFFCLCFFLLCCFSIFIFFPVDITLPLVSQLQPRLSRANISWTAPERASPSG